MTKLLHIFYLSIIFLLVLTLTGGLVSCNNVSNEDTPREPLSKEEINELFEPKKSKIQNAYFNMTYEEQYKEYYNSSEQVDITCYGVFDNAYCVIIDIPIYNSMTVITDVKIAEYTFRFSSSNTMSVYCDGEFYGLEKAYKNGILNDAEVEELYNFYTETKWGN